MTDHYDALETREPAKREAELFSRLPDVLRKALAAPAYAERLKGIDPASVTSRAALARLPVLRKSELPALHKAAPPFGGFVAGPLGSFGRLFTSPGPIFEPEPVHADPWRGARALFAAGFRPGDVVLNTFSYHLTPGGFIFDASARALGCAVIPAGPGNTEQQFELIEAYRPVGYSGTPDFLKILLDAAASAGRDVSSIKRALVSGAAFPKSLQDEVKSRGIDAYQAFGTADLGMVAFETPARDGMVVNEDLIMEIVRPGTGDPVAPGDVGEIVVTSLDPQHPWIRLALGDLTAALPGASPCGRTNMRIKGWMGRADQTTKVKGMFVRPEQIAEIGKRHPELGRLRLVVTRSGESDLMTLKAETASSAGNSSGRTRRDAARGDEARRQCRTGRGRLAAERRQGDRGRAQASPPDVSLRPKMRGKTKGYCARESGSKQAATGTTILRCLRPRPEISGVLAQFSAGRHVALESNRPPGHAPLTAPRGGCRREARKPATRDGKTNRQRLPARLQSAFMDNPAQAGVHASGHSGPGRAQGATIKGRIHIHADAAGTCGRALGCPIAIRAAILALHIVRLTSRSLLAR